MRRPPSSTLTDTLCPYTTLFRSEVALVPHGVVVTPDSGPAKLVRVLAYGDDRFRVSAVPGTDLEVLPKSLMRSEEHTSELQSLMRISYAVFRVKKNTKTQGVALTHEVWKV